MKKSVNITTSLLLTTFLFGCSKAEPVRPDPIYKEEFVEAMESPVPGTVTEAWEEPMVDTVEVPGQLDPTGTFYIPSHKAVVEIRPGRYQVAK